MAKKKLEVVELNKIENKIVLEEPVKLTPWTIFWKKYGTMIYLLTLIISLLVLSVSIYVAFNNLETSVQATIKETSIDVNLDEINTTLKSGTPMTLETAKKYFENSGKFKRNGEVLLIKTIKTGQFTLKFYSDYTALKISNDRNQIVKIKALNDFTYGVDEQGIINLNATTLDLTKTDTKKYSWGTVNYYSDGSADIIDSKIDMYVRNKEDIKDNYISNNKVSYLKEYKEHNGIELYYYYDGTIHILKNGISYLVRSEEDLTLTNDGIIFNNENEATIYKTTNLSDGFVIDYYTDGGAIIKKGTRTISVRKSNSIIINNNKIYEIVDNIYVEENKKNNNITYYTNGSAVIENYQGTTVYIKENSDIKYQNNSINNIGNDYEKITTERNIDNEKIQIFENTAVIKNNEYIAIVPKDSIIFDKDGSLKEIKESVTEIEDDTIKITNSTNEIITYRLVIEESPRTNLDPKYLRYQLSVRNNYIEPIALNTKIWNKDEVKEQLNIEGTNYILLEKTLEPLDSDEIKLMLWTDYDTIPNEMQDKHFYGTIKIYAYQKIKPTKPDNKHDK